MNPQQQMLAKMVAFAAQAHINQTRTNGAPYIFHPIRVYQRVAAYTNDVDILCASLGHDLIEDCGVTSKTVIAEFNTNIARLIQELTNDYSDHLQGDEKIEVIKKHAERMSPDAVLIKLCDRLDNLNDLENWKPARVLRYFRQTIEMLNAFPKSHFNHCFGVEEDKHTYPRQQLRNEIKEFIKDNIEKYMLKV